MRMDLKAVLPFDANCTRGLIKAKWLYYVCPFCSVILLSSNYRQGRRFLSMT